MRVAHFTSNISPEKFQLYPDGNNQNLFFKAHLTYDLFNTNSDERDLLIVRDKALSYLPLSGKTKKHYETLKLELLREVNRGKRTVTLKRIVMKIYNDTTGVYKDFSAAVYRYGAIPVFITNSTTDLNYRGSQFKVRIAVMVGYDEPSYQNLANPNIEPSNKGVYNN